MPKCEFPYCNYETHHRSQIHNHHIIPVENGGSDRKSNTILLCPTHHTKIYIPNATKGIHTIKGDDSIIILGWLSSTKGMLLEYMDNDENIHYYDKVNKTVI